MQAHTRKLWKYFRKPWTCQGQGSSSSGTGITKVMRLALLKYLGYMLDDLPSQIR